MRKRLGNSIFQDNGGKQSMRRRKENIKETQHNNGEGRGKKRLEKRRKKHYNYKKPREHIRYFALLLNFF
ncbi:uncharacterized protein VTP21DRAFT_9959 [Calcarisporiella thermophila]|uniref:uncharacterized protein n=1 Tax=Calcarisporiella thermophila TaxID=911321 RepID=UPI0037444632